MAKTPKDRRSAEILTALLPAGVMGLSMALAAADANAASSVNDVPSESKSVANRLEALRGSVSEAIDGIEKSEPYVFLDPEAKLAWWGNGWRNGGWRNGGWHNGGWGNGGWHNGGWGNGGWGNGGLIGGLLAPLIGSPGWGNGFRNW